MKDKLKIGLKGFVFGVANIIPGVSGGTIALTMGIYEDLISSISNIRKDFKKSMALLVPFLIGAVLSILLLSKVINFCLDRFPNPTILLFLGIGIIFNIVVTMTRIVALSLASRKNVQITQPAVSKIKDAFQQAARLIVRLVTKYV